MNAAHNTGVSNKANSYYNQRKITYLNYKPRTILKSIIPGNLQDIHKNPYTQKYCTISILP